MSVCVPERKVAASKIRQLLPVPAEDEMRVSLHEQIVGPAESRHAAANSKAETSDERKNMAAEAAAIHWQ